MITNSIHKCWVAQEYEGQEKLCAGEYKKTTFGLVCTFHRQQYAREFHEEENRVAHYKGTVDIKMKRR